MAIARASVADISHDSSLGRANSFAAQDESRKCRFLRSALQTSLYNVRITTKNMYNLYVLARNVEPADPTE